MVVLGAKSVDGTCDYIVPPFRAETAKVKERDARAQAETDVVIVRPIDEEEWVDQRWRVVLLIYMNEEPFLTVSLHQLETCTRESPEARHIRHLAIETFVVDGLSDIASQAFFNSVRNHLGRSLHLHKLRNGDRSALCRTLRYVLLPFGVVERESLQQFATLFG